ncbi:hypothetical protein BKA69DRAFT_547859 [Paraphysoderma sedebokerense]|nr:hypothetical protein BKA69DRAFT_547859 [Paraphysoderma sedebokerense]
MYSAQSGDFETLKSILSDPKHNLSPNYQTESKQMSPLHSACCFNHLEIVKYLVSIGADINIRDFDDWTPLHFAASEGNLEIVRYLCSFDHLELDAENSDGETVLEVIDEDEDGGEELRQEIELIFEEALTRQEAKGIKPPQQTRQEIPIDVPCTLPQKAKSASISDSTTAPTPAPVKSEQSTSKPPSTSTASNPQSSSSAPQKTVPVTQPEVNTTSSAPPSQPHPPKPAVSTNTRDVKEANTNPTPSPTVQQPTTQKAQVNEIVQTTSPASSPSKDQTSPQRNDSTPTKASTQIPSRTSSQSQSQSPTQQAPSSPIPQQQDPESEEPLPSTFRIASLVQAWKSLETQPNSATSAPFRNRNVSQRALNKIKQMEANGTSSPSSLASSMMDLTSNGGGPNSGLAFSGRRSSRSLARLNNGSNSNSNGSGNQSSSPTNSNDASRTASISLSESNAASNYIATSSPSTQNPQQVRDQLSSNDKVPKNDVGGNSVQDAQSQQQDAESDQGTTDRSKLESVRKLIASWNLKKK